ncbi:MAG: hypothetical protein HYU53_07720 [Acidobacteria bacterium]|nr:hypothetical protein [Acidobacteriota bacterium]
MFSSRIRRSAAVLTVGIALPVFAFAQGKNDKNQKKQDEAKRAQYLAMSRSVDAAMAQPSADSGITWSNDLSLKAQENRTYVPFTVSIDPSKLNEGPAVAYIRVATRGAAAPAQPGEKAKDQDKAAAPPIYPFEDLQPVELKAAGAGQPYSVSRAFAVPAGDYDVYVAVAEQVGKPSKDKAAIGRTAVLKQPITVPQYWGTELTTSPVILAEKIDQLSAPLSPEEQMARPYVLGGMEILPAADKSFTKKEELSLIFLIYNAQVNETGKPDLEVEYRFNQKTGETEKFFNRTQPQLFNATTLPPQFDVRAGHQVVGGQTIPLASFPEGEYRLEIKINDKLGSKTITRDVTFIVAP